MGTPSPRNWAGTETIQWMVLMITWLMHCPGGLCHWQLTLWVAQPLGAVHQKGHDNGQQIINMLPIKCPNQCQWHWYNVILKNSIYLAEWGAARFEQQGSLPRHPCCPKWTVRVPDEEKKTPKPWCIIPKVTWQVRRTYGEGDPSGESSLI